MQADGKDVKLTVHDDRGLLALQGPSAASVLQALTQKNLSTFYFSQFDRFDIAGIPCWVTRTGYAWQGMDMDVASSIARG